MKSNARANNLLNMIVMKIFIKWRFFY